MNDVRKCIRCGIRPAMSQDPTWLPICEECNDEIFRLPHDEMLEETARCWRMFDEQRLGSGESTGHSGEPAPPSEQGVKAGRQFVYHATLLENLDRISRTGLKPRKLPPALASETGLTRGLYVGGMTFVRGYAMGEAESMFDLGEAEPPIDMAILEISIPRSVHLTQDTNFPGEEAYIIDVSVPPGSIKQVGVVRFSPTGGV